MARVAEAERVLGPDQGHNMELRGETEQARAKILFSNSDEKAGLRTLDHALTLVRAARDTPPGNLAGALRTKGYLLSDDGRFDAADVALRESLTIYRRMGGNNDLLTGKAWLGLALNDLAAGHLALAESRINAALRIERKVLDPDNPVLANAISTAGQIYQAEHKPDAASKGP